jgi:adenylate kinase family enzyme
MHSAIFVYGELVSNALEPYRKRVNLSSYMRISVVGLPGSGKTTLAEKLSKKINVPHIHIDRFWFEAGGLQVSHSKGGAEYRGQVRAKVRVTALKAHMAESWVSDGFYASMVPEITERADIIIYIKIPLARRLWNHAKRMMHPRKRHKELNWKSEVTFFYQIVRRDFVIKPKLENYVEENKAKAKILKSYREVDAFVADFKPK